LEDAMVIWESIIIPKANEYNALKEREKENKQRRR
jgi:hypothetical protein